MADTLRLISRKDWGSYGVLPTGSEIDNGSLQRIADALETYLPEMAKNHAHLTTQHDMFKRWYQEQRAIVEQRDRTIAALRGQITKLKKKGGAA